MITTENGNKEERPAVTRVKERATKKADLTDTSWHTGRGNFTEERLLHPTDTVVTGFRRSRTACSL